MFALAAQGRSPWAQLATLLEAVPGLRELGRDVALLLGRAEELAGSLADLSARQRLRELAASPGAPGGTSERKLERLAAALAETVAAPDLASLIHAALGGLIELADAERGFLLLYTGLELTHQVAHGDGVTDHDAPSPWHPGV